MSVQASVVVALPMAVVEGQLWDVTTWPSFLSGVEQVRRSAPERYVFTVRQGRRRYEVLMAVRWRARDHRFLWRALEGPRWDGELALMPMNGRRTKVRLTLDAQPRSLFRTLLEVSGTGQQDVRSDLNRLRDQLSKVPVPARPPRMEPARMGPPALLEEPDVAGPDGGGRDVSAVPASSHAEAR